MIETIGVMLCAVRLLSHPELIIGNPGVALLERTTIAMIAPSLRTCAALTTAAAALFLAACGQPAATTTAPTTAPTTASTSATTTASANTTSATAADASAVVVPTATAAAAPAAAGGVPTRVSSSQGGVFSVEMPAGWKQNPDPYTVPSITLDDPAGGNLQITSLRYAQPPRTITQEFSNQRDAIAAAFPSCNFPAGADVIGEKIGDKAGVNYRVLTCPSMPFAFTIFTANGPGGEMLAGHDADFGGKADRWKSIVASVLTDKK